MHNITKPKNINELRELVTAISRKDSELTLGNKALYALGRLVQHPEQTAVNNIAQLAQYTNVNASTLSRLAKSLGYDGFNEFQQIFRQNITNNSKRFYSDQGQRLINLSKTGSSNELETIAKLFNESVVNIENCLTDLNIKELTTVAKKLAKAPRIRVHGIRQVYPVAASLVYGLSLIRPDVALLDTPALGIAEELANMQKNDVLIVISTTPYSKPVIETSTIASKKGITVIALTDYRTSALAVNANYAFYIPYQSSYISNSIGAYIVLCEGIINSVAKQIGNKAVESLQRHEQFIEELGIEG